MQCAIAAWGSCSLRQARRLGIGQTSAPRSSSLSLSLSLLLLCGVDLARPALSARRGVSSAVCLSEICHTAWGLHPDGRSGRSWSARRQAQKYPTHALPHNSFENIVDEPQQSHRSRALLCINLEHRSTSRRTSSLAVKRPNFPHMRYVPLCCIILRASLLTDLSMNLVGDELHACHLVVHSFLASFCSIPL